MSTTKPAHTERKHAKRSPSSSKRWINCPGSIRMEENIPDVKSAYAAEGVAAHELAEICLKRGEDACEYVGKTINGILIDGAIAEAVQIYIDWFWEKVGENETYLIEEQVHISIIEDTGTADAIIYLENDYTLVVGDLKFGRGVPIEAEDNTQGLLYALGAVKRFHNRRIDKVEVVIIQPRCPHPDGPIRTWIVKYNDLLDWAFELQSAVDATKNPEAPLVPGDHCKFCKAAPTCPALHQKALEIAMADFGPTEDIILSEPETLSAQKLAKTLEHISVLELWCKRVKEYAHTQAANGRTLPGYKLVSTRANRRWKDEAETKKFLTLYGLTDQDILKAPELKSVAQLEKTIGKKNIADIEHLIEKVSTGVTLAKADDPRPPVTPDALADFGASIEGEPL
jgi:hypothetical protein